MSRDGSISTLVRLQNMSKYWRSSSSANGDLTSESVEDVVKGILGYNGLCFGPGG